MMVETKAHDERKAGKSGSIRTCAGCGKRDAAEGLVRLVLDPTGESTAMNVAVDLAGSGFGRGAHVHASPSCIVKALRGGLARVLKSEVTGSPELVGAQIVAAADRRIEGLLAGARRGRLVAVGADVVRQSLREGKADLVVVARDAAAAADLPEVRRAIGDGKAVAFSDKKRLGALFSRDEVAVIAVLDAGVAAAIASTHAMSRPFRSEAWWSPEVR